MENRLLFDGVDVFAYQAAVYQGIEDAALVFPDLAESAPSFFDSAVMGTEQATYRSFFFPALTVVQGLVHKSSSQARGILNLYL